LRYLLPLREDLEFGIFLARTELELAKEYKDLDARGKSKLYSIYATQSLIERENLTLNLNLGFDYKDIFNFQLQREMSRDRMRVVKCGLDVDLTDRFGRTLIINELNFGIPEILGGLKEQDSRASRSGSGGKFIKDNLTVLRLQKMPFNSTLLWKNQFQFSSYILPATEQFQIGGVSNVRGYPPAEKVGDKGYATTLEWSFPPYFVPRDIKVYEALRFAIFYDWANTRLRRPQATEEKRETLRGAGWGMRFTLARDFFARIDFAWPLDKTPSDSDHLHTWVQVSKSF
jgi:hemolysin activation/secretion protein